MRASGWIGAELGETLSQPPVTGQGFERVPGSSGESGFWHCAVSNSCPAIRRQAEAHMLRARNNQEDDYR